MNEKVIAAYEVGEKVKEDGNYVCVPCGYKRHLHQGESFPPCLSCMKESKQKFAKDLELWEKVSNNEY